MKNIILLAASLLTLSTEAKAADAVMVYGQGNTSCGLYIADRASQQQNYGLQHRAWAQGFLSGLRAWRRHPKINRLGGRVESKITVPSEFFSFHTPVTIRGLRRPALPLAFDTALNVPKSK